MSSFSIAKDFHRLHSFTHPGNKIFVSPWQLCNTNILNLDASRHLWEHRDISIRDVPVRLSSSFPLSSPARDRENMIFSTSIVLRNTICFCNISDKIVFIKAISWSTECTNTKDSLGLYREYVRMKFGTGRETHPVAVRPQRAIAGFGWF